MHIVLKGWSNEANAANHTKNIYIQNELWSTVTSVVIFKEQREVKWRLLKAVKFAYNNTVIKDKAGRYNTCCLPVS